MLTGQSLIDWPSVRHFSTPRQKKKNSGTDALLFGLFEAHCLSSSSKGFLDIKSGILDICCRAIIQETAKMSFSARKFSITHRGSSGSTTMPARDRRFSSNQPSENGEISRSARRHIEENFELTTAIESNSKIHRQFRSAHEGHRAHAGLDPTRASTGVVWCTERAYEHGFLDNPSEWYLHKLQICECLS
jgi:hypothetical protein